MVCRVESFIHEQATDEGSSDSGKELQHFSYLDRRNRGADGTEYTAFSARRHQSGRGRSWMKASITRPPAGPKHTGLAVESVDRPPNIWFAGQDRGIIDQVARREVVCAVNNEVVIAKIASALSWVSISRYCVTRTCGLISATASAADSTFGLPTSDVP